MSGSTSQRSKSTVNTEGDEVQTEYLRWPPNMWTAVHETGRALRPTCWDSHRVSKRQPDSTLQRLKRGFNARFFSCVLHLLWIPFYVCYQFFLNVFLFICEFKQCSDAVRSTGRPRVWFKEASSGFIKGLSSFFDIFFVIQVQIEYKMIFLKTWLNEGYWLIEMYICTTLTNYFWLGTISKSEKQWGKTEKKKLLFRNHKKKIDCSWELGKLHRHWCVTTWNLFPTGRQTHSNT